MGLAWIFCEQKLQQDLASSYFKSLSIFLIVCKARNRMNFDVDVLLIQRLKSFSVHSPWLKANLFVENHPLTSVSSVFDWLIGSCWGCFNRFCFVILSNSSCFGSGHMGIVYLEMLFWHLFLLHVYLYLSNVYWYLFFCYNIYYSTSCIWFIFFNIICEWQSTILQFQAQCIWLLLWC